MMEPDKGQLEKRKKAECPNRQRGELCIPTSLVPDL